MADAVDIGKVKIPIYDNPISLAAMCQDVPLIPVDYLGIVKTYQRDHPFFYFPAPLYSLTGRFFGNAILDYCRDFPLNQQNNFSSSFV